LKKLVLDAAYAEALCLLVNLEELLVVAFLDVVRRLFHDDEGTIAAAIFIVFLVAWLRVARCPVESHVAEEVAGAVLTASAVAPRDGFVIEGCLGFFSVWKSPAGGACTLSGVERVEPTVRGAVFVLFVVAFAVGDFVVDILCHPELSADLHKLVGFVVALVGHRRAVHYRRLIFWKVD